MFPNKFQQAQKNALRAQFRGNENIDDLHDRQRTTVGNRKTAWQVRHCSYDRLVWTFGNEDARAPVRTSAIFPHCPSRSYPSAFKEFLDAWKVVLPSFAKCVAARIQPGSGTILQLLLRHHQLATSGDNGTLFWFSPEWYQTSRR